MDFIIINLFYIIHINEYCSIIDIIYYIIYYILYYYISLFLLLKEVGGALISSAKR